MPYIGSLSISTLLLFWEVSGLDGKSYGLYRNKGYLERYVYG